MVKVRYKKLASGKFSAYLDIYSNNSGEVLFDDQKEVFAKLKEESELFNKSMFGSRYSG